MSDPVGLATEQLRAAGIESARRESRILWEHALKRSLSPIEGQGWDETAPRPLTQREQGRVVGLFESFVARRIAREPIAYITGEKEFWSLPFKVGPGALVPRPETETLIAEAMREFPARTAPLKVLDLGTGTGCLLVTFLVNYPNARGIGVDRSGDALAWAIANAQQHGVLARSAFLQSDWERLHPAKHDLVFANPPYVVSGEITGLAPDVKKYEPVSALDGGPDGLAEYRAIAPVVRDSLTPQGLAFLEIGQGQHHMVSQILESESLQIVRVVEDLAGTPRCVVARQGPAPGCGAK